MNSKPEIEKLERHHEVSSFDCGQSDLNRFLIRFALTNQQSGSSNTFVALVEQQVVAYYTLVVTQLQYEETPGRLKKGLARHPVPMMLIARLAVHKDWQGKRLGTGMLKNAVLRTRQAMEIASNFRGILVHAKDLEAVRFYEKFGFVQSPSDPLHMVVLLKDVQKFFEVQ